MVYGSGGNCVKKEIILSMLGSCLFSCTVMAEGVTLYKPAEILGHNYQLQKDSYEATNTDGGLRHYICSDCGDEYSYETDPLIYEINPKTGEAVDQANCSNPLLPDWEHVPDGHTKGRFFCLMSHYTYARLLFLLMLLSHRKISCLNFSPQHENNCHQR